jgi:hypothetical protein
MPMNSPMSIRPTLRSFAPIAVAHIAVAQATMFAGAQVGSVELGSTGLGNTSLGTTSLGSTTLGATNLAQFDVNSTSLREVNVPRRLLARHDFEENEQFPMELPEGWARVLSRGTSAAAAGVPDLPDFGAVKSERGSGRKVSKASSAAGSVALPREQSAPPSDTQPAWSLNFTLAGASMAVASKPGQIAVEPGAQLTLSGFARTSGLRHAGARIGLQYHDAQGKPLGAPHTCEPMRSEDDWREMRVVPPAAPDTASSVTIWLEVVQPKSLKVREDTRFSIVEHDVAGNVHFDDIEIWQLPAVSFEATGSGVVEPERAAQLLVRCSDPASTSTQVDVRVRDASDRIVHVATAEVPSARATQLTLPVLPTGWYEAEARFSAKNEPIAVRRARFAVLPHDPFKPDEPPRFGASLGSSTFGTDAAVELARAAFVVIPIWETTTDTRESRHELQRLRTQVSALLDRRVEPMFRVAAVPESLAREQRIDGDDTLALFALEEARWRPVLEPWLLAFGQQVEQWFIADAPVEATREGLPARIDGVARTLGESIAGPSVGVPWWPGEPLTPAIQDTLEIGRHTLEIVAEPAWRESAGEMYEGFPTGARGMVRIVPLEPGTIEDRERAIDIGLRAIDAWRAGFDAVSVEVRAETLPPIPGPPLELAAWRQISTRLCGRRFVAEIPIADGVRALLGDGPRGTVLVLWRDGDFAPEQAGDDGTDSSTLALALGSQPVQVTDLWGRGRMIAPSRDGHPVPLGREIVFVEGVDRALLELRAGFRVDPGFATARRAMQEGTLVLANPWPTAMSGTLTILAPDALGMSPKAHAFTVPPNGEARLPVQFSVPRTFFSGETRVRAVVEGTAEEPFRAVLDAPLEVGFREVAIEHSWRLARSIESGAIDLILTLRVTNISDEPIDVEAFAVADGYTQNKKPITALAPGETAVRVFPFADGVRRLSGRDIRAGVHDEDGDARTLRKIAIPPLLPPLESVVAAPESSEGR